MYYVVGKCEYRSFLVNALENLTIINKQSEKDINPPIRSHLQLTTQTRTCVTRIHPLPSDV
jgi:hypothetical protein